MIQLERTFTVPAGVERAFDYVADFTTTAQWDPGILEARQTAGTGPGLASRYEAVARFRDEELTIVYETRRYERPRRLVFRGSGDRFLSMRAITFAAGDGGTTVTYAAAFRPKGLLRLAEPFLRPRFADLAREAVAGLAAALSDGT